MNVDKMYKWAREKCKVMKHGVFQILFHTLLLVLVNAIQGCDDYNIDLGEPPSIAPEEEAAPANNPTPNSEQKIPTPDAQQSDASTTVSAWSHNTTASGTTHNNGGVACAEATTTWQVDSVTHNQTNKTVTINATENATLSTTSSITSASSCSQASVEHTNLINTAQQQILKSLLDALPTQIQTNIDNYLIQGPDKTALSSLQYSRQLLEEGAMNHSQLKILWHAISMGAKQYVENFNVTNKLVGDQSSGNYYRRQDETSRQLVQIESTIAQISVLQ